jgi:hypothetical protein
MNTATSGRHSRTVRTFARRCRRDHRRTTCDVDLPVCLRRLSRSASSVRTSQHPLNLSGCPAPAPIVPVPDTPARCSAPGERTITGDPDCGRTATLIRGMISGATRTAAGISAAGAAQQIRAGTTGSRRTWEVRATEAHRERRRLIPAIPRLADRQDRSGRPGQGRPRHPHKAFMRPVRGRPQWSPLQSPL